MASASQCSVPGGSWCLSEQLSEYAVYPRRASQRRSFAGTGVSPTVASRPCSLTPVIPPEARYLLPVPALLEMDAMLDHQELLRRRKLVTYTEASCSGRVMYVSHAWISRSHPDPRREHFTALRTLLARLAAGDKDVALLPHTVPVRKGRRRGAKRIKKVLAIAKNYSAFQRLLCCPNRVTLLATSAVEKGSLARSPFPR